MTGPRPPSIADMSAGEDAKRANLEAVDLLVRESGIPAGEQVAVLMLASVLAIRRLTKTGTFRRGKVVNAATADFREKVQRFL